MVDEHLEFIAVSSQSGNIWIMPLTLPPLSSAANMSASTSNIRTTDHVLDHAFCADAGERVGQGYICKKVDVLDTGGKRAARLMRTVGKVFGVDIN